MSTRARPPGPGPARPAGTSPAQGRHRGVGLPRSPTSSSTASTRGRSPRRSGRCGCTGPSTAARRPSVSARPPSGGRARSGRGRPRCAGRCGRCPGGPAGRWGARVSSTPSSSTDPSSGRSWPQTQLNTVVLPAPLGPTRPTLSPRSMEKVTSLTALMPPNCLESPRTSRSGVGSPSRERPSPTVERSGTLVPLRPRRMRERIGRSGILAPRPEQRARAPGGPSADMASWRGWRKSRSKRAVQRRFWNSRTPSGWSE